MIMICDIETVIIEKQTKNGDILVTEWDMGMDENGNIQTYVKDTFIKD